MKQNTQREYHREGHSVRLHFGECLPSADTVRGWPVDTAAYHVRDIIRRMIDRLNDIRARGRFGSTLYDINQHLALLRMLKCERELLHELTHQTH